MLCKLLGHRMVLLKNHTHLWYRCRRCGEHGWQGKRIDPAVLTNYLARRST